MLIGYIRRRAEMKRRVKANKLKYRSRVTLETSGGHKCRKLRRSIARHAMAREGVKKINKNDRFRFSWVEWYEDEIASPRRKQFSDWWRKKYIHPRHLRHLKPKEAILK